MGGKKALGGYWRGRGSVVWRIFLAVVAGKVRLDGRGSAVAGEKMERLMILLTCLLLF